ncbi:hypothetical protein A2U01_0090617, partial [Trifolium medium]|nr:hypothetical protein [Trifolium medium]
MNMDLHNCYRQQDFRYRSLAGGIFPDTNEIVLS